MQAYQCPIIDMGFIIVGCHMVQLYGVGLFKERLVTELNDNDIEHSRATVKVEQQVTVDDLHPTS